MNSNDLYQITMEFKYTKVYDLDDYIQYCVYSHSEPSQQHYKQWAHECLLDDILEDIHGDKFKPENAEEFVLN